MTREKGSVVVGLVAGPVSKSPINASNRDAENLVVNVLMSIATRDLVLEWRSYFDERLFGRYPNRTDFELSFGWLVDTIATK